MTKVKHISLKQQWKWFLAYQKDGKQYTPITEEKHVCTACGQEYEGNFCPRCGQKDGVKRFTLRSMLSTTIFNAIRVEDIFVRTILDLMIRPGYMIREFINGSRKMYVQPVKLFLVLAMIFGFAAYLFGNPKNDNADIPLFVGLFKAVSANLPANVVSAINWVANLPYSQTLFSIPFLMIALKLTFLKRTIPGTENAINFAETFIFFVYIYALYIFYNILAEPFTHWMGDPTEVNNLVQLFYLILAIHQFYQLGWWKSIGKCLLFLVVFFVLMVILIIIVCAICHFVYGIQVTVST